MKGLRRVDRELADAELILPTVLHRRLADFLELVIESEQRVAFMPQFRPSMPQNRPRRIIQWGEESTLNDRPATRHY